MRYNEETNLFEITFSNIAVTNSSKPEFKVVKTPMEGENIWYPTGGNWVITPEYIGGEYEYDITITFDPSDSKKIGVSGLKVEDIVINPENGADIFEALILAEMNVKVRNISINLVKNGNYTIIGPLTAYANLEIQGNGATIDASSLNNNFIQMATTANPAIEYISIHNATVKGLKKPLFYSTQTGYLINWLTIDNCIIEMAANVTSVDFTKGSVARNFNIENSSVYAPTAIANSFYSSQNGQKLTEFDSEGTRTFTIKNSTMYNLATGKNFFTHRQNNQTWLAYDVQNNIFVNCGKSGQVIRGMNGGGVGSNPTWIIKGNAFNFDNSETGDREDKSAGEETGDPDEIVQESVDGVVTFSDAAGGDFSGNFLLAKGATAPKVLGDPRWAITFQSLIPSECYTEFDEGTGTLTYYYDGLKDFRKGMTEVYDPANHPLRFNDYYNKIVKVIIDPSMSGASLTSMKNMFYGGLCTSPVRFQSLSALTSIEGLENLNTETVTDMSGMFTMCQLLTELDLSTFNTSNVTTMNAMFSTCSNLQQINVSSFDVTNITDFGYMFNACSKLQTIYCSGDWSTGSAKSGSMFTDYTALIGGKGTTFDAAHRDKSYARLDGGTENPGYFTAVEKGDVNNDGVVDIADVVAVLNTMASDADNPSADVNADNVVDIADVVAVLNIMAGQ